MNSDCEVYESLGVVECINWCCVDSLVTFSSPFTLPPLHCYQHPCHHYVVVFLCAILSLSLCHPDMPLFFLPFVSCVATCARFYKTYQHETDGDTSYRIYDLNCEGSCELMGVIIPGWDTTTCVSDCSSMPSNPGTIKCTGGSDRYDPEFYRYLSLPGYYGDYGYYGLAYSGIKVLTCQETCVFEMIFNLWSTFECISRCEWMEDYYWHHGGITGDICATNSLVTCYYKLCDHGTFPSGMLLTSYPSL